MKTRLITTLTAIGLTAIAGTSARADVAPATLEWQQPGYVMDVIVVTAPRPQALKAETETATPETTDVTLAWQEPGYVQEVVVVTASRSEVLANARKAAIDAARARDELFRKGVDRNIFGVPTR